MRRLFALALLLPSPALADVILAQSRITAVTVYPQGAQVTREVVFTAPAGQHDVTVPGLPLDLMAQALRVSGTGGAIITAQSLTPDPAPRDTAAMPAAWQEAKARVTTLEAAETAVQSRIDSIAAAITAAEAQVGFLSGLAGAEAPLDASAVDTLKAIASMIGAGVAGAQASALAARTDLRLAEAELARVTADLAQARDVLAGLPGPDEGAQALDLGIALAATGEARLTLTYYMDAAGWSPVYDLWLTRAPAALRADRGVLLRQTTGEDWAGVQLAVTTSDPGRGTAPATLWPLLRRITEPQPERKMVAGAAMSDGEMVMEAAPAPTVGSYAPETSFDGFALTYAFPHPVTVPAGDGETRLHLDTLTFAPKVSAVAVPAQDPTAYVQATFTNDGGEGLLPGTAYLMREGALVGVTTLEALPAGAEAKLPFGPIDGLRLKRLMPQRAEGDRGIFVGSTQIEESAVIEVENLTAESWPLRVLDQVPYSEQEDLEISFTAEPSPSEVDVDGQRGVLAWELDLPPGETREIRLAHRISWPEGMVLE